MKNRIWIPIVFTLLMWSINSIQFMTHADYGGLGIHPGDKSTLIGIFTAPLIHGNWEHLLSNTLPLLIFGLLLFSSYPSFALQVWSLNYMLTGILVWMFARPESYHIGASGIIYGLGAFLLFSGFFRMDIRSIAIASGVAVFYGGMIWGILPLQTNISWESHLFGGITGLTLAFLYKNETDHASTIYIDTERKNRKSFDDFMNR